MTAPLAPAEEAARALEDAEHVDEFIAEVQREERIRRGTEKMDREVLGPAPIKPAGEQTVSIPLVTVDRRPVAEVEPETVTLAPTHTPTPTREPGQYVGSSTITEVTAEPKPRHDRKPEIFRMEMVYADRREHKVVPVPQDTPRTRIETARTEQSFRADAIVSRIDDRFTEEVRTVETSPTPKQNDETQTVPAVEVLEHTEPVRRDSKPYRKRRDRGTRNPMIET
jgi:hypothetical protein